MAAEMEFAIGATASCSDGVCGEVSRMIVDPATRSVTHLVIEPKHRRQPGRLVPLDLVGTTTGEIRLRCTIAEFDQLDPAEETELLEGAGGTGALGMSAPMGISHAARTDVQDVVPLYETEVGRGEPVHALDGEIGQVEGFLVDPGDHRVTHVLLREGHLWGRKEVAIPMSAVTGVENGIRLNMTKKQIEDLPSAH
jgi:sporulation protein YlmC with PRC-barrel domain